MTQRLAIIGAGLAVQPFDKRIGRAEAARDSGAALADSVPA